MPSSNIYSRQAVLRQVLIFKPRSFLKSKLVATAFYYCHRVSSSSILRFCDLIVPEKMRGGVEANRWSVSILDLTQKNIYFCFIDYVKAVDCVDHNKQWKILQDMEIPEHLTCLLRNLYAGQEATVWTGRGTTDWFQIVKRYVKAVYYPAYLTYMQSTSWETLGWRKHKLESRLPGEISIISDMQMTPPLRQKVK